MKYKNCKDCECKDIKCKSSEYKDSEADYSEGSDDLLDGGSLHALFDPEEEVHHLRAERKKWARMETVIDSGAAESVAPASMAPWVPTRPSEGSKRGQVYMSANGAKLPNLGEKQFKVMTAEGNPAAATFQVAEVTRPLCSVTRICDRGNRVVFTSEGGYIENMTSGVQTGCHQRNNVYVMEMYVEEPPAQGAAASGFARPRE